MKHDSAVRFDCLANGCPLPGSMSDSTRGMVSGLCRYHFAEADAGRWHSLTQAIRQNLRLIQALQALRNADCVSRDTALPMLLEPFIVAGADFSGCDTHYDRLCAADRAVHEAMGLKTTKTPAPTPPPPTAKQERAPKRVDLSQFQPPQK